MEPNVNQKALRMIDAVGLAACLAVTGAVFVLGVQPLLDRQSRIEETRAQLRAQELAAQQATLALSEARKRVVLAEQAAAENPLRLQPIDRLNAWLALIAETATKSGVELDQLEPGQPLRGEHYVTVPIRVVGRGSFVASTRFLHRLHEAMPDTGLESMDLKGQPRTPDAPATFQLELKWHASPEGSVFRGEELGDDGEQAVRLSTAFEPGFE